MFSRCPTVTASPGSPWTGFGAWGAGWHFTAGGIEQYGWDGRGGLWTGCQGRLWLDSCARASIRSGGERAAEKGLIRGEIGGKRTSGAEARIDSVGFMRGLKPPPPSGLSFSAACEAVIDSAGFMPGLKSRPTARMSFSAARKATVDSTGFMRGLKPPPPSGMSFSAACEGPLCFGALTAPFDSAQGRLLKSCPFKEASTCSEVLQTRP